MKTGREKSYRRHVACIYVYYTSFKKQNNGKRKKNYIIYYIIHLIYRQTRSRTRTPVHTQTIGKVGASIKSVNSKEREKEWRKNMIHTHIYYITPQQVHSHFVLPVM